MSILGLIFGERRLCVPAEDGAALLNICMKYSYSYSKMGNDRERTYIVCLAHTASRVAARCRELGIDVRLGELCGLPELARRYRKRFGLMLGIACAVVIVSASQNYVWDIRVSGYDGLDEAAVVDGLMECGFFRGGSLVGFSADAVENLFLRNSEDIGWISINMKGTVAYVEVLPKYTPPADEPTAPANVVASRDGVIVEMISYNGLRMVERGESVREGQLLISGAYGEKTPGLHITRASGKILARTFHSFLVEIPLEYEEKVETGRVFSEKFLIFFKKEIKVFSNYGNLGSTCDTIIRENNLSFLGSSVPVLLRDEIYVEYETVRKKRSEQDARVLAEAELEKVISEEIGASEIEKREVKVSFTDSACVIECELICIEDIAKTVEFSASFTD